MLYGFDCSSNSWDGVMGPPKSVLKEESSPKVVTSSLYDLLLREPGSLHSGIHES